MHSRRVLPFVFSCSLLWTVALQGQTKAARDLHDDGVAAIRKNEFQVARQTLQKSLALEPNRPAALYNLGLVEFRSGNEGLGIGLWRKALIISPGFVPARDALAWGLEKLPRAFNRNAGFYESFRAAIIARVGMMDVLILVLLVSFFTGFLFLRYFGARRRALLDESPLPPFPVVAVVFSVLLATVLLISAIKAYDLTVVRATVLADRTPARTNPDSQAASLFDLFEGTEVVVRQSKGDWWQVSVPGGLTGWVPQDALFFSSSRQAER